MSHDPEVWLWDALAAAKAIEKFIGSASAEQYASDDYMMSAVERKFEIIGEALNNYSKADAIGAAAFIALAEIIGFRNRIAHGYRQLDPARVYQIARAKIPQLRAQLEAVLAGKEP
ncbi:MAG: DUF86 domain-containing protein [Pseudomonadota bacterium]